jgi:hypothetical protein
LSLIRKHLIVFVDVEQFDELEFVESVQVLKDEPPGKLEKCLVLEDRVAEVDGVHEIY